MAPSDTRPRLRLRHGEPVADPCGDRDRPSSAVSAPPPPAVLSCFARPQHPKMLNPADCGVPTAAARDWLRYRLVTGRGWALRGRDRPPRPRAISRRARDPLRPGTALARQLGAAHRSPAPDGAARPLASVADCIPRSLDQACLFAWSERSVALRAAASTSLCGNSSEAAASRFASRGPPPL